jgi:phospholipase D1/2
MPIWPEGSPTDDNVQATLEWQRRTMEMMYDDIATALRKMKMDDANPRDYLTFFCLGNREVKKSGEYQPAGRPEDGTHYARAQKARRFMIYVHSKLMIGTHPFILLSQSYLQHYISDNKILLVSVDDEYIILGSANVNQRSMDGARDTEIAIGGYQKHRLNTKEEVAKGQVHGFRMSLWYEHLGITHADFLDPGSLACVQRVNDTADKYWNLYTADELNDDLPRAPSHLSPHRQQGRHSVSAQGVRILP